MGVRHDKKITILKFNTFEVWACNIKWHNLQLMWAWILVLSVTEGVIKFDCRGLMERVTAISPSSCWLNKNEAEPLTRRYPVLLIQWVLNSGIASARWMLSPPHRRCRTPFLSCFYSWWNLWLLPSVHPKMSSVETETRLNILQSQNYTIDIPLVLPCSRESRLGVKEKRECWISH